MCDSMSPYFTNTGNSLPYLGGTVPGHHDQFNGDLNHQLVPCHENGRGPPIGPPHLLYSPQQPPHHQSIHYGHQQYPRFPPYDRLETKHCTNGSSQAETSPYYSSCAAAAAATANSGPPPPPSQVQPPSSLGPLQQQSQQQQQQQQQPPPPSQAYDCSGRGSITPPSLDGSNGNNGPYGNCKMPPMLTHNDSMPPLSHNNSPSPHHGQHPIYGNGPVGSPTQNSNSNSLIYPWMRSQFGMYCLFKLFILYFHLMEYEHHHHIHDNVLLSIVANIHATGNNDHQRSLCL